MDDTAKKVALVAQAIERVMTKNARVIFEEPGIYEEAARQAIAAFTLRERKSPDIKTYQASTEWVYPVRTHSPDGPLPPGECDSPSP